MTPQHLSRLTARNEAAPRPRVHVGTNVVRPLGIALTALLALALLTINLTTYPAPWFDEGYFLATARMLAQHGLYALPNSDGPWIMDPSITSGPVLIVPLALVFKLFGVGMLQARLTAVAIGLLALAAYWRLARRLAGAAAFGALLLLLAGSHEEFASFAFLARQAIGEVAALGLCLYGFWLWMRALDLERPAWWRFACAGLALGLAVVAKPQMIVGIAPTLAVVCLADRIYYRQASWRAFILCGLAAVLCVAAWNGAQIAVLGLDAYLHKSAVLGAGVRSNILSFDPAHVRHALGTLWRSGFLLWGLPGLLYGLWRCRTRDREGLANCWPAALAAIWLAWFVTLSIGWPRYAFVPLALAPIWMARLLADAFGRGGITRIAVALAFLGMLGWNVAPTAQAIFGPQDDSAERFSAALSARVPAGAVVESWEWNLDATATARFHHPSPQTMYRVIDLMQRDLPVPGDLYDPAPAAPAYIVDGPFSSWTGVYRTFIAQHGQAELRIGQYTLYRVVR